jgi:hypothetical protein
MSDAPVKVLRAADAFAGQMPARRVEAPSGPRVSQAFRDYWASLPSEEAKKRYNSDAEFKRLVDAM